MEKINTKGYVLAYDRASLPAMMIMTEVVRGVKERGICVWDSSLGGTEPKVMHLSGDDNSYLKDIKIIDINKTKDGHSKEQ